jgi:hypothetical protein
MFTPAAMALAHRQDAAVEIGAIAQVGKHVRLMREGLLPNPGRALAAHLREARGGCGPSRAP